MTDSNKSFEHEVKYKRDTSKELNLEQLGFTFINQKHQIDTYLMFDEKVNGINTYIRVRNDVLNNTASIDRHKILEERSVEETEINISPKDIPSFISILQDSTRNAPHIVDKKRQTYKKDDISIMLDDVENLGSFIEIEIITKNNDSEMAMQKIEKIESLLGLEPKDRFETADSYPDLLAKVMNKQ